MAFHCSLWLILFFIVSQSLLASEECVGDGVRFLDSARNGNKKKGFFNKLFNSDSRPASSNPTREILYTSPSDESQWTNIVFSTDTLGKQSLLIEASKEGVENEKLSGRIEGVSYLCNLLQAYKHKSENLESCIRESFKEMKSEVKAAGEISKVDSRLIDFHVLLAIITDVGKGQKPWSKKATAKKAYVSISSELSEFEETLSQSERKEILNFLRILKDMWTAKNRG